MKVTEKRWQIARLQDRTAGVNFLWGIIGSISISKEEPVYLLLFCSLKVLLDFVKQCSCVSCHVWIEVK
jgi:hypothetical protein